MKKYCVFDLDGTLMDSMGEWANRMLDILKEDGIDYPENIISVITPLGYRGAAELFAELGVKGSFDEIVDRMCSYAVDAYTHRIVTKKGVPEYLKKLLSQGHVLAVLTASPHYTVDVCLKRNGIYDLFEKVFTVDDFGLVKAQPEIYFETAKALGTDISQITFFDDNLTAIKAAKKAGLETVGVYDASSDGDTEEIKKSVDRYITSFEELL
ncbi:MAG: HAD family hydrolase [Ruminococcaceae bacterium]|nr:HAD family hydrolase [Oscillospiraceae bacterium]